MTLATYYPQVQDTRHSSTELIQAFGYKITKPGDPYKKVGESDRGIGISKQLPYLPFFGAGAVAQIGVLEIGEESATLNVYGENNLERMQKLAQRLANKIIRPVYVKLAGEKQFVL